MSFLLVMMLLQFLYCVMAFCYTSVNVYLIHNDQVPLSSTPPSLAYKFIGLLLIILFLGFLGFLWVYIFLALAVILVTIFGSGGLIDSLTAYKLFPQRNGYSSKESLIFAILVDVFGVVSFSGGILAAASGVI